MKSPLDIRKQPKPDIRLLPAPDIRKQPKPDIRKQPKGNCGNPYALFSGETPGRLGKAWQAGFDGLTAATHRLTIGAKGTPSWRAYHQGALARHEGGIV